MSQLHVLIVGASIAGPATAYWLAKAGARVTVIERFPELRTSGQAVDIRTAGVSVMRKMTGMEAQVRANSTQEEGICFVRHDGRPYGIIRSTGNPDQQSIVSEFEIFRGDLSKVLFDLTANNPCINYIFGEQIASMRQSGTADGPVTVEFSNGTSTSEYDLVVACDGATSRTRAMGLGGTVRDHIIPVNCWSAYFSIGSDLLKGSKVGHGFSAVGGRFISLGSDPRGFSRAMLMGVHPRSRGDAMESFREASSKGDRALKDYIAKRFQSIGWESDRILREMMDSDDFYASEVVQVKVPNLHRGRFTLVGDAGYAAGPSGGGTSLALAGAYILAGEICKHPNDLATALGEYEEQMRPIIKGMQTIPSIFPAVMAPQTAWGIWLRNYLFAFIAWTRIAEFVQKYIGAGFASTEDFPLPEYDWVA